MLEENVFDLKGYKSEEINSEFLQALSDEKKKIQNQRTRERNKHSNKKMWKETQDYLTKSMLSDKPNF